MKKIEMLILGVLTILSSLFCDERTEAVNLISQESYKTFYRLAKSRLLRMSKESAWKSIVPQIETVKIMSSADSSLQPALFYNPAQNRKRPLLVALHSWSADYKHQYSIPFGVWAVNNGWVFIHPDYRGTFTNKKATASELAIQDVLDALRYAQDHADVDPDRIYLTGFSGGAMVTLIMVGRYPEIWAGAAAWVPVYSLSKWYRELKNTGYDYSIHIRNSCGGPPFRGSKSYDECQKRSASSYLKNAFGKNVPVYLATGINDRFVFPSHTLMAFNDLADPKDRIGRKDIIYIDRFRRIPENLAASYIDSFYLDVGLPLLFERKSKSVVLKVFKGRHDIIFNAGLYWLSWQRK